MRSQWPGKCSNFTHGRGGNASVIYWVLKDGIDEDPTEDNGSKFLHYGNCMVLPLVLFHFYGYMVIWFMNAPLQQILISRYFSYLQAHNFKELRFQGNESNSGRESSTKWFCQSIWLVCSWKLLRINLLFEKKLDIESELYMIALLDYCVFKSSLKVRSYISFVTLPVKTAEVVRRGVHITKLSHNYIRVIKLNRTDLSA